MEKRKSFYNPINVFLILIVLVFSSAFTTEPSSTAGSFTYSVNGKEFILDNMKAVLRTTTGGRKQLSISNDRFVKFFFIDPKEKNFNLRSADAREAIIRYNEPGTNNIYAPASGSVKISKFDIDGRMIKGEFELNLTMPGTDKVIAINKGTFNVPIVVLR